MNNQEKLKELATTLDALEEMEISVKRILQHKEMLSSIPSDKLTSRQRLWLSAFNATEKDLPLAFENTEAQERLAELLYTLDEEREENDSPQNKTGDIKKKKSTASIVLAIISVALVLGTIASPNLGFSPQENFGQTVGSYFWTLLVYMGGGFLIYRVFKK